MRARLHVASQAVAECAEASAFALVLSDVVEDNELAEEGALRADRPHLEPGLVFAGMAAHGQCGRDGDAFSLGEGIRPAIVDQPLPKVTISTERAVNGPVFDLLLDPQAWNPAASRVQVTAGSAFVEDAVEQHGVADPESARRAMDALFAVDPPEIAVQRAELTEGGDPFPLTGQEQRRPGDPRVRGSDHP